MRCIKNSLNMKAMKLFALTVMMLFAVNGLLATEASLVREAEVKLEADLTSTLMQDQKYGEDSARCVRNWSLYAEYFRQRNYEMAYEPWRYMLESCPEATLNIYIHGTRIINYFFQQAETAEEQEAWVDTLMMVYNRRIEHFGNEGEVLGRKAADLYTLQPNNVEKLVELTERSIELSGINAGADVLLINFQAVARMVNAGLKDAGDIIDRYERANEIVDYNVQHNPDDRARYASAKNNIQAMFRPFASCDNLVNMFTPRFEEHPEDKELLEQITSMLEESGCTGTELFFLATSNLHALQPAAESAFLLGRLEVDRENFQAANDFFAQAVELYQADDPVAHEDQIFRAYWIMAEASYRQLNRMPQARRYALRAHEVNPADGRPLILIGEMYAASAEDCGDDEFYERTAYWAAVDKFNEARRVAADENIRDRAAQFAGVFSQYFPNNEDIFMYGYSEGDTFRVECWINENTIIRARPR